eukprot:g3879.t1
MVLMDLKTCRDTSATGAEAEERAEAEKEAIRLRRYWAKRRARHRSLQKADLARWCKEESPDDRTEESDDAALEAQLPRRRERRAIRAEFRRRGRNMTAAPMKYDKEKEAEDDREEEDDDARIQSSIEHRRRERKTRAERRKARTKGEELSKARDVAVETVNMQIIANLSILAVPPDVLAKEHDDSFEDQELQAVPFEEGAESSGESSDNAEDRRLKRYRDRGERRRRDCKDRAASVLVATGGAGLSRRANPSASGPGGETVAAAGESSRFSASSRLRWSSPSPAAAAGSAAGYDEDVANCEAEVREGLRESLFGAAARDRRIEGRKIRRAFREAWKASLDQAKEDRRGARQAMEEAVAARAAAKRELQVVDSMRSDAAAAAAQDKKDRERLVTKKLEAWHKRGDDKLRHAVVEKVKKLLNGTAAEEEEEEEEEEVDGDDGGGGGKGGDGEGADRIKQDNRQGGGRGQQGQGRLGSGGDGQHRQRRHQRRKGAAGPNDGFTEDELKHIEREAWRLARLPRPEAFADTWTTTSQPPLPPANDAASARLFAAEEALRGKEEQARRKQADSVVSLDPMASSRVSTEFASAN